MSNTSKRWIAWILRRRGWMMLASCVVLGIIFRFWRLDTIPPALAEAEAATGLAARQLAEHFSLAALGNVLLGREALFIILEAIAVAALGHTELAIRVVPAVLGCVAVLTTSLWANSWWGRRVALVAALVMAVTPWAVILERTAYSAATIPLLITLGLWLGTKARHTGRLSWAAAAGAVMGLGCYAYPAGWPVMAFASLAILGGLIWRTPKLAVSRPLIYVGALVAVMTPFIFGLGLSSGRLVSPPVANVMDKTVNQGNPVTAGLSALGRTVLMINFRGDSNYAHNVAGEPQLNIFVGIMAVFGLLIALTMLRRPRYAVVLGLLAAGLVPGVIGAGTAPDALRTFAAIVPLAALAGVGVSYMINYWYNTFPINSAARTTGFASMLLLLGLSVYHGYTAYFVAWADAPGTYLAQSESTTNLAKFIKTYPTTRNRVLVVDPAARGIVRYLVDQPEKLKFITADEIAGLPESLKPAQVVVDRSQRDAAVAALRIKFSGGQLRPHYSDHSDEEIYAVYETK